MTSKRVSLYYNWPVSSQLSRIKRALALLPAKISACLLMQTFTAKRQMEWVEYGLAGKVWRCFR